MHKFHCHTILLWSNESILKEEEKDPFVGPQEFVVGYSKTPEQLQSTGREPATIRIAAYMSIYRIIF